MPQPSSHIVVIGAGVIGLSSALELQSAGHGVTLLARDFPTPFALVDPRAQIDYTSPWGGAHNRWVPPTGRAAHEVRDHRLALATFHRMRRLRWSSPEAGITFLRGVEYLEAPGPEYEALVAGHGKPGSAGQLGLEGFRVLGRDELPDDRVRLGFEYDTWCVNPMVYCSFLLDRFVLRGGRIVRREVRGPEEVFEMSDRGGGPVRMVVNASGTGFGDPESFIIRATVTRQNADGSWSFCVPRNFEGGTVIGGTKEPDNWDTEPSQEVRERLCRNFVATYPSIADESGSVRVLKDIVGRRPARHGGARLEREEGAPGKTIIHAYGLGGRGYEMSWGVAETVASLAADPSTTKARI
ncbi:hypothetical protein SLS53_004160 [Cytospora paraplurivora]|uniref:FAD dependent oxidoreductase domain-containing protein n=1 Tax=Cytospora paraplurivora TaxID=2898453 RepID=A0AAN9U918_9PEZI